MAFNRSGVIQRYQLALVNGLRRGYLYISLHLQQPFVTNQMRDLCFPEIPHFLLIAYSLSSHPSTHQNLCETISSTIRISSQVNYTIWNVPVWFYIIWLTTIILFYFNFLTKRAIQKWYWRLSIVFYSKIRLTIKKLYFWFLTKHKKYNRSEHPNRPFTYTKYKLLIVSHDKVIHFSLRWTIHLSISVNFHFDKAIEYNIMFK